MRCSHDLGMYCCLLFVTVGDELGANYTRTTIFSFKAASEADNSADGSRAQARAEKNKAPSQTEPKLRV